jgi:hypothetical protein
LGVQISGRAQEEREMPDRVEHRPEGEKLRYDLVLIIEHALAFPLFVLLARLAVLLCLGPARRGIL